MRTARSIRLTLIGSALVFALVIPSGFAAQKMYSRIVVFGTSLSDPGNAFAFQKTANTPPYLDVLEGGMVPSMSYAKGGHHFTNGATWIEQFARSLGLAGSTRPAWQSSGEATNYAVGATRARQDGENLMTFATQVDAFLADFNGQAPADALYVIEMGANDVRDALTVYASGNDGSWVLEQALQAIGTNIQTLYAAGARQFLVWNVPDIGLTPVVQAQDDAARLAATGVAAGFNENLRTIILGLSELLPGIEITTLDVFGLLDEIATDDNKDSFGLSVIDRACIMPNQPPFECKRPDEYLFWDGIHPTTAAHAIIAQRAATALAQ